MRVEFELGASGLRVKGEWCGSGLQVLRFRWEWSSGNVTEGPSCETRERVESEFSEIWNASGVRVV